MDSLNRSASALENCTINIFNPSIVLRTSATKLPLEEACMDAVITDPPYYDNVSYADLSDFFYVWLKRSIGFLYPEHFSTPLTPKKQEAIMAPYRHNKSKEIAKQSYETIPGLPHGHVEQDPGTWIDTVSATIREAVVQIGNRKSDIVAIGVSAQQHGLVTLDVRNEPIRPAKLWCDTSTGPQAEKQRGWPVCWIP